MVRTGAHTAQQVRRARILLELEEDHAASSGASVPSHQRQVGWQFTTEDARVKLGHLYPERLAPTVY